MFGELTPVAAKRAGWIGRIEQQSFTPYQLLHLVSPASVFAVVVIFVTAHVILPLLILRRLAVIVFDVVFRVGVTDGVVFGIFRVVPVPLLRFLPCLGDDLVMLTGNLRDLGQLHTSGVGFTRPLAGVRVGIRFADLVFDVGRVVACFVVSHVCPFKAGVVWVGLGS